MENVVTISFLFELRRL